MAKKQGKKVVYLSVRLSKSEEELLDDICAYHIRKRCDMIRYLIIIEHKRITEIQRLRGELEEELHEET